MTVVLHLSVIILVNLHINSIECYTRSHEGLTSIPNDIDDSEAFIDLSHNLIQEIPYKAFGKFNHLRNLYLANNSIDTVHPEAFLEATSLEHLYLYMNKLTEVPHLEYARSLVLVQLNQNNILQIDSSRFQGLTNLRDIHLRENPNLSGLFSLPELPNLQFLNINLNNISSIDVHLLSKLSRLYVASNPYLSVLPELSHLSTVTELCASSCGIETMPDLTTLPALWKLELDGNKLSGSLALPPLPSATIVNLGSNHLTSFIVHVTNFEEQPAWPLLTDLNLEHNQINFVSVDIFQQMPKIREINLIMNPITFLEDIRGFAHNPLGLVVRMYGVIMNCKLSMCWVADDITMLYGIVLQNANCEHGNGYARLADLTKEDFCTSEYVTFNITINIIIQSHGMYSLCDMSVCPLLTSAIPVFRILY